MHDVATVGVEHRDQEVPAVRDAQVHDVRVPALVRPRGLRRRGARAPMAPPPREQLRVAQDAIDARLAQIRDVGVDHLPGEPPIAVLGMRQRVRHDRRPLFRQHGLPRRGPRQAVFQRLGGGALHPTPIARRLQTQAPQDPPHSPPGPLLGPRYQPEELALDRRCKPPRRRHR